MDPEQHEIEGVPEGWRVAKVYPDETITHNNRPTEIVCRAILERIPKAKHQIVIAELDLTAAKLNLSREFPIKLKCHWGEFPIDSWRIEERDV